MIDYSPAVPDFMQALPPLEEAKQSKYIQIDAERNRLSELPISYSGITIEADKLSQGLLTGKLLEISAKASLGITTADMFWKDIFNTVHTWATLDAYLLWLQGVAIAISERTTALYVTAWEKKATVAGFTDVSSVLGYIV